MSRVLRLVSAILLGGLIAAPFGVAAQAQESDKVEVILAIDTSASMRVAIGSAKAAANEFIASMPPDVAIGVETFADAVTVLSPPTTDRSVLATQIDSIATGGDTALYDVVIAAGQHFTPGAAHKVLVVLSDGKDEGSAATLDEAIAATGDLHVEAISLTTSETDVLSLMALGPVTAADDPAGVSAAFARVAGLVVEVIESVSVPTTITPTTAAPTTTPAPAVIAPAPSSPVASAPPAIAEVAAEPSRSSMWLWLGAAATFGGLFLLGLMVFPRERVSKARLGINKPRNTSEIGTRTVSAIDEALERYGKRADLGAALSAADISTKPAEFVASVAVVAIVAGLVGLLVGGPVLAVLISLTVSVAARVYVSRAKAKRLAAFADQLPDVLQLVTTSLRSGYGITQALESVAEEAEEPARSEFAQVLVESRMGRDLSSAMHAMARRMECTDLEWVVSAIDINRETGGNLSDCLLYTSDAADD